MLLRYDPEFTPEGSRLLEDFWIAATRGADHKVVCLQQDAVLDQPPADGEQLFKLLNR